MLLRGLGPSAESQYFGTHGCRRRKAKLVLARKSKGTKSVYATAVREALIKMEDEKVTQHHPAPSDNIFERPDYSSSYAELARVIRSTLLNDVDRLGSEKG